MSTTFLRILAVPKRHTLRSSSSSLATSSTCNHFLRLVDTIARAPILTETIVTSPFELLLQILETIMLKRQAISFMRHFPSFLSITTMSGFFASTPSPRRSLCSLIQEPDQVYDHTMFCKHANVSTGKLCRLQFL